LKLVFVNRYFHPDISATSQLLTDLAFDQAARGAEVHVVTSRQLYEDASASLPAEDQTRGVRIHRVATTRFGRAALPGRALDYASFYLSAFFRLLSLLDPGDTVVAKTDPPLVSVVAAAAARLRGARLINWLQDVFPEVATALGVRIPFAGVARRLRDRSLRAAAANIAVGRLMRERLGAATRAAARIEVIDNWADGAVVRPLAADANPLRERWGLAGRFVIGYSGNMGRAHEFETILAACTALRDDERCVFLFVGSGRQRAWIESEARRRSLANVLFQPYQPRELLAQSLSAPDIHLVTLHPQLEGLIVPSKYYGIAAAGRPTLFVGDTHGEIAQLLERDQSGWAIPAGAADELLRLIARLRDRPEDARAAGALAREAFEREYDRPLGLARWAEILLPR
jgi:colanic acid biosynthesis glycosyl transferase WcaI